ncbi:hypothetical protein AK812_SmicGene23108 [Symbiodinium microadriaticum]|uniref:Uncharacterized protein n=1 Tax=Symbiodinium microadriaticum TaxID=2951 RepID=A0A1Q9DI86_SYMMI|nr:hypothetical protein AK812_SmicGene23108 [Symbiodinium microadriaticum]
MGSHVANIAVCVFLGVGLAADRHRRRNRSLPISEDGGRLLETLDAVEPLEIPDASGLMLNKGREQNHVVTHFFRDVEAVNSQTPHPEWNLLEGIRVLHHPVPCLELASEILGHGSSSFLGIYAMIVRRSLQSRPGSRSVIFVPKVSVAQEVCKELETCHVRTNLISGKVCLANRANLLINQHFHIKLVDDVTADMFAEFSTCFSGIEVDHDYTLTCAVSGRTALPGKPQKGTTMEPMVKGRLEAIVLVNTVFTRVERARQCAEQPLVRLVHCPIVAAAVVILVITAAAVVAIVSSTLLALRWGNPGRFIVRCRWNQQPKVNKECCESMTFNLAMLETLGLHTEIESWMRHEARVTVSSSCPCCPLSIRVTNMINTTIIIIIIIIIITIIITAIDLTITKNYHRLVIDVVIVVIISSSISSSYHHKVSRFHCGGNAEILVPAKVVLADPNFRQDACRQLAARAWDVSPRPPPRQQLAAMVEIRAAVMVRYQEESSVLILPKELIHTARHGEKVNSSLSSSTSLRNLIKKRNAEYDKPPEAANQLFENAIGFQEETKADMTIELQEDQLKVVIETIRDEDMGQRPGSGIFAVDSAKVPRKLRQSALDLSDQKSGPTRLIHAFDADVSDEELVRNARRDEVDGGTEEEEDDRAWDRSQDVGFSKVEAQLFKDASAQLRAGWYLLGFPTIYLTGMRLGTAKIDGAAGMDAELALLDVLTSKKAILDQPGYAGEEAASEAGKLSEAEAGWLRNCEVAQLDAPSACILAYASQVWLAYDTHETLVAPTWLISLAAWMRYYERKPRKNASGHEKLQRTRLQKAMQMLRKEQLSTAERLLLTDSLDWLEEVDRCGGEAFNLAMQSLRLGRAPRFVSDDLEHLQVMPNLRILKRYTVEQREKTMMMMTMMMMIASMVMLLMLLMMRLMKIGFEAVQMLSLVLWVLHGEERLVAECKEISGSYQELTYG